MRLSLIRVSTWIQALILLEVRNSCREGMTHSTEEITFEQQRKFWAEELLEGDVFECYLLLDDTEPVGYGLLKRDSDKYWMTAGLTPKYRGKGLSRLIINFITEMGHREGLEVWIDVYDDNLALIGDIRNGYEFVESRIQDDGRILHIMKHSRDRILHPKEAYKLYEKTGENIPSSIVEEMIEVDDIHRGVYAGAIAWEADG